MTITKGSLHPKNAWVRGISSGWAAFDLKERQKQGMQFKEVIDLCQSMSISHSTDRKENLVSSHGLLRPFYSVVQSSSNSEISTVNKSVHVGESITSPIQNLRKLHSWADDSLIADILLAVNNDENNALEILKSMAFSTSGPLPVAQFPVMNMERAKETSLPQSQPRDQSGQMFSVPVEPEWEQADIYLSLRKDALKMMRSSSRHFRIANNAYMRGDRLLAKQFSVKAREEYLVAEKLNGKAAQQILLIRNNKQDPWTLDLHGLHASEAVSALKIHLCWIERQMPLGLPMPINITLSFDGSIVSSSLQHVGSSEIVSEIGKKLESSRGRRTMLHVITGTGNHSHGHAALPMAVRTFLIENRYYFDDARTGVFAIQPKFRYR